MSTLTVKQLREHLAKFPDTSPVLIWLQDTNHERTAHDCVVELIHDNDSTLNTDAFDLTIVEAAHVCIECPQMEAYKHQEEHTK